MSLGTGSGFWLWNGRLVPESALALSPWDRGFRFGDGLYETLRVHLGRPFRLAEHLRRMARGLQLLEIDLAPEEAFPTAAIAELIAASKLDDGEGRLRLFVTRGVDRGGALPPVSPTPTRLAMVEPLPAGTEPSDPRPLRLITVIPVALRPASWAWLKSLNHLPYVLAAAEARRAGADDGLLVSDGRVRETTSANLFVVRDGSLWTPPLADGVLAGVTRDLVLELARGPAGSDLVGGVEERSIKPAELAGAEEIMVTGSVAGVRAVAAVNGSKVRGPVPGPVTQRLREAYGVLLDSACRGME